MSFVGGKLNLKGGLPGVDKKQKKNKKKDKDKGKGKAAVEEGALALVAGEEEEARGGGGGSDAAATAPSPPLDTRTDAQKRHDAALAAREAARIKDLAAKSHRERVAEFNDKLAAMSEHHDIPKVGPG